MNIQRWRTGPPVLQPDPDISWLVSHTGSAAGRIHPDGRVEVLVSGRDDHNRSHIGRVWLDPGDPWQPAKIEHRPVLSPGTTGAFDDCGTSYPCIVDDGDNDWLLYTGWTRSVTVPFHNDLGLARADPTGTYTRVSRAPILARTDADHLSIGSSHAIIDDGHWRLWYTSWTSWGDATDDAPHHYLIKYAESDDGHHWRRNDLVSIGPAHPDEHSICSPSVLRIDGTYHMWFCSRGDRYRIHHAHSPDGITWTRTREPVAFATDTTGFDDLERAYPCVLRDGNRLLMLYSGNGYGRSGLGVATLDDLDALEGTR